jgi:hypothetical protein
MEVIVIIGVSILLGLAVLAYLEHCKHDFEIIKSFVTESEVEQLVRLHYKPTNLMSTTKKNVTILRCRRCSKIKKIVVTND